MYLVWQPATHSIMGKHLIGQVEDQHPLVVKVQLGAPKEESTILPCR